MRAVRTETGGGKQGYATGSHVVNNLESGEGGNRRRDATQRDATVSATFAQFAAGRETTRRHGVDNFEGGGNGEQRGSNRKQRCR